MNKKSILIAVFSVVFLSMLSIISYADSGMLEITQINARVDYEPAIVYENVSKKNSVSGIPNGSSIDADIYPGSEVEFEIRMASKFKKTEEPDIRDVIATITLEKIDDGADVEKESTEMTLEPDEEKRVFVKLKIPQKVDLSTFNVNILAEGDYNGTHAAALYRLKLPVRKESHDIRMNVLSLNNNAFGCDRKAALTVGIYNAGKNEEDQIKIEIKNDALGINFVKDNIHLANAPSDSDIEFKQQMPISVSSNAAAGNYPITANLYWHGILFTSKTIDLRIANCALQNNQQGNNQNNNNNLKNDNVALIVPPNTGSGNQNPITNDNNNNANDNFIVTKEFSLSKSPLYVPLLVGLNILVVLVIAAIAAVFVKRKNNK